MAANFQHFMTIEEAAQLLGVSVARISMWIGECKLPVAARSEYAGFLLRTLTVETVARDLADALPPEARCESLVEAPRLEAPRRVRGTRGQSACAAFAASADPNLPRGAHMT
jgi:hypothetical protein